MLLKRCRVALIQHCVNYNNKYENLKAVSDKLRLVKENGADIAILPECFNSEYGPSYFPKNAESIPASSMQNFTENNDDDFRDEGSLDEYDPMHGYTWKMLREAAKANAMYIIGGSMPELEASSGKIYNTCLAFDRQGSIIGKHRKIHLFDIDIPGKITFKESLTLTAGEQGTIILTEFGAIGLGICYDLRFSEYVHYLCNQRLDVTHIINNANDSCPLGLDLTDLGPFMLVFPGAFNWTTGPLHWELLLRARAVDNQVFVAAASTALDKDSSYQAYGHSLIADPFGKLLAHADAEETILYADLDPALMSQYRIQVPILQQKRYDIYPKG